MHEDIFAIFTLDKTEALGIVEPLHRSFFHCLTRIPFLEFCFDQSEGTEEAGNAIWGILLTTLDQRY